MKASRLIIVSIGLLALILIFLLGYYYFFEVNKNTKFSLVSPINLNNLLKPQNKNYFWYPNTLTIYDSKVKKPEITATSAISYDISSNKLLYEKDIRQKLPIASLTKVMTSIIAIENEKLTKKILIDKNSANIGEDVMGLSESEQLSLEDLLYGLILHSGNDAAEAIASGSKFGRQSFVYLMNQKAEDLGLSDTHFTNPSGLEGDGNQYSTALDLLIITRYALQNPVFAKIVSTIEYDIPYSQTNKEYYIFNETNLLTSYPGVKGVKTGLTDEAGYCLLTYLEYDNHKIIAVLLNSSNRRQEMKDLLDYSLKTLGSKPPPHS